MKTAIIGTGKTGGQLLDLLPQEDIVGPFNSKFTLKDHFQILQKADIAISFVPGSANQEIIPLLIEAKIPAVFGGTGFNWAEDLSQTLKEKNLTWIYAPNFALGMTLVMKVLKILGQSENILRLPHFYLEETHHVHKKDKPSGTALAWKDQLNLSIPLPIKSYREDDVVGKHSLTIQTETEEIVLTHTALNRKIFAEGALWTAKTLLNRNDLPKGLYSLETLLEKFIL